MSVLQKMTYAQVENALSDINYNNAIKYYKNQRDNFEEEFRKTINANNPDLAMQYINNFVKEFNEGNYQGQSFGLVQQLTNKLGQTLASRLSGNEQVLLELRDTEEKSYSKMHVAAQRKMDEAVNTLISQSELQRLIKNFLKQQKLDKQFNTEDLLSSSLSYIRQTLLSQVREEKKLSFNNRIMAGYFEEALVHKAFMDLANEMNIKTFSLHTGSKKIKKGTNLVDPIFDEYINFFSNNLNKTFAESIQIDNTLKNGYGIQVKLWNAPQNVKKARKSYHISSNAQLYQSWEEKRSWIKGIHFLEKKVREAMGDNVAYILGNNFIWTHEMIESFFNQKYYLAFYYDMGKKKFTESINWEQINMDKP